MAEEFYIDFETPYFIIQHYNLSGCIAVLLNVLVIYLILFHSGKIGSFKYYLLGFQISCIILDLNVTIIMQPIGLFPICAGYSNGFMSRKFNWSSHSLMTMLTFFLALQVEVLTICFLRKHKVIMKLKNSFPIPDYIYIGFGFLLISYATINAVALFFSYESHEKQLETLQMLYPNLAPKFRELREFQYYITNDLLLFFLIFTVIGCSKAFVLVSFMALNMYKTLKQVQTQLSSKTLAKHRAALLGLIAQFTTTPIVMLPGGIVAMTVLFPTYHSQKITWYSIMAMTTHSTFNAIVVVFSYPEFRKTVFCQKYKDLKRQSVIISVV